MDLAEIHAHIAQDKPIAASRFIDSFFELFQLLAKNPGLGQQRRDLRPNLRSISHGNYVVFYYPFEQREGVEVAGVLHGAREIENLYRTGER